MLQNNTQKKKSNNDFKNEQPNLQYVPRLLISHVPKKHKRTMITNSHLCHTNNFWNTEVCIHGRESLANDVRLICLLSVHVHFVLFTVHSHGPYAQFCTCSENSDSNFTCKLRKPLQSLKRKVIL